MKKIHVNQHRIRANAKNGTRMPIITVKDGKRNHYAHEVEIIGPSKVVYQPDCPLSCGARVWIETDAEVMLTEFKDDGSQEITFLRSTAARRGGLAREFAQTVKGA